MSRALPFWFSREIGSDAVDHAGTGFLLRGLAHAAVTLAVASAVAAIAAGLRLRRRPHLSIV